MACDCAVWSLCQIYGLLSQAGRPVGWQHGLGCSDVIVLGSPLHRLWSQSAVGSVTSRGSARVVCLCSTRLCPVLYIYHEGHINKQPPPYPIVPHYRMQPSKANYIILIGQALCSGRPVGVLVLLRVWVNTTAPCERLRMEKGTLSYWLPRLDCECLHSEDMVGTLQGSDCRLWMPSNWSSCRQQASTTRTHYTLVSFNHANILTIRLQFSFNICEAY